MEADRLDEDALRALPNLASIRHVAERLMPSSLRLYVGYGAEDEETVASNTSAWSDWSLRPRVSFSNFGIRPFIGFVMPAFLRIARSEQS